MQKRYRVATYAQALYRVMELAAFSAHVCVTAARIMKLGIVLGGWAEYGSAFGLDHLVSRCTNGMMYVLGLQRCLPGPRLKVEATTLMQLYANRRHCHAAVALDRPTMSVAEMQVSRSVSIELFGIGSDSPFA
jgi:hypothetical protein